MLTSHAPVYDPRTLADALRLRGEHPEAMPIAGGTDVMVFLESGAIDPPAFLNLWGIAEMAGVEKADDGIWIGALTTYTQLIHRRVVQQLAPSLIEAARTVGAAQIQNRGTLAGNIANASPAGDTLPVLLSLDARIEVSSVARGRRVVPIDQFWLGYREIDLEPDELITRIWLPARHADDHTFFRKIGTRQAQSISKVVIATRLRVTDGIIHEARVALGSVAATPVRARNTEAALVGKPIAPADPCVADALDTDIQPIDDVRSTAEYRLEVAKRALRSYLRWLADH